MIKEHTYLPLRRPLSDPGRDSPFLQQHGVQHYHPMDPGTAAYWREGLRCFLCPRQRLRHRYAVTLRGLLCECMSFCKG